MKREGAVDTKDMTVELNKDEFEKFLRIGYGVDRAMWIINDRCKDGIMNFIKTKRNGAKERRPSGGLTSRRSGMDHSADAVGHEANVTCHARKTIGHLSGRLTGH